MAIRYCSGPISTLFTGLALGLLVLLMDWLQEKVFWLATGCLVIVLLLLIVLISALLSVVW